MHTTFFKKIRALFSWIYGKGQAGFWDVTQGNNADGCCFTGFQADVGWDPATGVGTPNFEALRKLI
jgi:tripeptidyl-peptidase-1